MFKLIKNPIDKFKEAYGIFWDIYAPVVESLINLVFSILLALKFGIIGVVIGTIISNVVITFIWKPYVIFKHIFKEKFYKFFLITGKYMTIALIGIYICCQIMKFIQISLSDSLLHLIALFIEYGLVATLILLLCFICDKFFRDTFKKYIRVVVNLVK